MIQLFVTVKSIGKRKAALTRLPIELLHKPRTLRELIEALVEWNVQGLMERQQAQSIFPFLNEQEVRERADNGKVGFGAIYHEGKPNLATAIDTAILAYTDDLYRVFINDEEIKLLDESLSLKGDDEITLIRLTMLAGSYW
ncbi:hypothetical protein [Paenibacillus endoradicis]|uniref:hypothetical protein n=1 Tax=Paenibacillus endoradicis TaxID=2972487 RepID=UPI0021592CCD|nr:hypothetical protein [Paenibacillus endoradicis]MCR8656773.1 hypothetical protein [Paenibacillus endoradicis]